MEADVTSIALDFPMLVLGFLLAITLSSQDLAVRIVARDYSFDAPERIAGPQVRIRIENAGREPHYLRFLRVSADHSLDDFASWRKAGGPMPQWLRGAGGAGTIAPGESLEFSAEMQPGRYIIMCGHPSPDGTFHVDKGMYRMVTVTGDGSVTTRLADATVVLSEHLVDLFGVFRPGEQQYLIENRGKTTHQALFVRLPDGVTAEQELDWFRNGSKGTRPGQPVGGIIELAPTTQARVVLQLRPGRYVLFCSVPGGEKRHFDFGMMRTFEVLNE
jgi:uncharacterized cupredoxin-like copper-binding protein